MAPRSRVTPRRQSQTTRWLQGPRRIRTHRAISHAHPEERIAAIPRRNRTERIPTSGPGSAAAIRDSMRASGASLERSTATLAEWVVHASYFAVVRDPAVRLPSIIQCR